MRLGALELLTNIFSGRITANDKDPFPHQLALQQYMKTHEGQVQRLLVADEVGLGKTIEIGLVLRDILIARGQIDKFRCLYLTKGGLLTDVQSKLRSVIQTAGRVRRTLSFQTRAGIGSSNSWLARECAASSGVRRSSIVMSTNTSSGNRCSSFQIAGSRSRRFIP